MTICALTYFHSGRLERFLRDVSYKYHHEQIEMWKLNVNHNPITKLKFIPTSICFITLETRSSKYLDLHNHNLRKYVEYQNQRLNGNQYTYLFKKRCDCSIPHEHNPYWCKLFIVQEYLLTNKYDFVVWLDSDTVITNPKIDLTQILQSYESHIYCSTDESQYYTICAGVFAFRNSPIGKDCIQHMTKYYNSNHFKEMCLLKNNKLDGKWAQTCYEQGVMNNFLYKYYKPYVTILTDEIIRNNYECHADFILHQYNTPSKIRESCFIKFT
jgi:hypothetical protein